MDRARNSLSRREFLGALTVTTGAGLVGAAPPRSASAEPPPETTRIRWADAGDDNGFTPLACQ